MSEEKKNTPKISIGMPVYNGEKFIGKRLDSILSQSYQNFELIISDNGSKDSTSSICKDYEKKDQRIRYIQHKKNKGVYLNFKFVLEEAKCKYFVWASVDDIWDSCFLEKNIQILTSNKNCVCSISKTKFYGLLSNGESNAIDSMFRNFLNKLKHSLRQVGIIPLIGSYEQKISLCLKKSKMHPIYGVYRTDKLRRSIVNEQFVGIDLAIILNVLKFGDFHVIDEVLMSVHDAGLSKKGIFSMSKELNSGSFGIIFPMAPLTSWCAKNLGIKLFLKNIDYFILLNLWGGFSIFIDIIRIMTHKIFKK